MRGPSVQQNMQGVIYGSTYLGHEKKIILPSKSISFFKSTNKNPNEISESHQVKTSDELKCFKNVN